MPTDPPGLVRLLCVGKIGFVAGIDVEDDEVLIWNPVVGEGVVLWLGQEFAAIRPARMARDLSDLTVETAEANILSGASGIITAPFDRTLTSPSSSTQKENCDPPTFSSI